MINGGVRMINGGVRMSGCIKAKCYSGSKAPLIAMRKVDLSTSIADIQLSSPIWNASGVWCTTAKELETVVASPYTGAVTTKSCTLLPREGNPRPRYAPFGLGTSGGSSINSMGLPNQGFGYYVDCARHLGQRKPYFISIAGLSIQENLQMLSDLEHDELVQESSISGIELNLSCPNVPGKPQTCYDFIAMDDTLRQVFEMSHRLPLGVKLSPYFDPIHFDMAADVLKKYPRLKWVTCINSIGNGLVIDPIREQTIIHPKNGLGGIGGQAVKATALSNVWNFRQRLPASVDIIGCGGVFRGLDVFEHLLCGASAVQIGTLVRDHGVDAFRTVSDELTNVMSIKGYGSIIDFKGKLKTVSPLRK